MTISGKIEIPSVIPLHKKYTRTFFQEDSLVSNIRRALQREIPADLFESQVIPVITEEERAFLSNYYVKREGSNGLVYSLKSIPLKVSAEAAKTFLGEGNIDEDQKRFLFNLYLFNETEGKYVLKNSVTESDEIRILQMFKQKSFHIRNVEKALISEILEKAQGIAKKDVFFANLYTPPTHKFFSPPNLKHISGMQITESARQFGIACHHIYGGVPFEGVTFLLQYLNAEFFQYAKLTMPIKMRAILKDVKYAKDGSWNYSNLEITVYQENVEISKVSMAATILPLKVYKRLKSGQAEVYEIDPRFRLLDKFKNNISIRDQGNKFVCSIENMSQNGFMVKAAGNSPADLGGKDSLEFFMHFDIAGFVHGKCSLLWVKQDDHNEDTYYAGFKIEELSPIDSENLKESIDRYGRLIEEREIF
ncbi:AfsA-related hotdog domain-containing protein [Leptospira idonii]|uniref:Pilus assembly protein PilZ n=1 Tax=Leptospira idonii TaxID=1193500 RepID=A0A4R9M5F4_9LEPT|nr:AfsA-related hotdog domain-containing protein [Leptospira idonii]TGN21045.1 pilus assembly protein PilZ [Leptospira idonii]